MKNGKKLVSPYTTLLDVCMASQRELAKFFSRPGVSFGDLRRQILMARQRMNDAFRAYADSASPPGTARRTAMMSEEDFDTEDAYIEMYLARLDREERYPEDCQPLFSGGTLEKKSKNTMTYRQYKRNVRANNNRQHTRQRSFRQSI